LQGCLSLPRGVYILFDLTGTLERQM